MRLIAFLIVLLLAACGDSDSSSSVECAELDESACEADSSCRAIRGGPAAEFCADDLSNFATIYAGCVAADQGCGDSETCAADPVTGQRLFFPDTCVPEEWGTCDCAVPSECLQGGEAQTLGRICVRGTAGATGESITANSRVVIEATPEGCFSSGCVLIHDRVCDAAVDGTDITLDSLFCIGPSGADSCLPDCGGAGVASCQTIELAEGKYTVTGGGLSVTFQVPSEVPFGGECDGDPIAR